MESGTLGTILLFEGILIFLSVPAGLMGLKFQGNAPSQRLWFEPPGYMIPVVWAILVALLAVLQTRLDLSQIQDANGLLLGLLVLCASYPYYTLGLEKATGISAIKFGLLGNAAILFLALKIAAQVGQISPGYAYFILPLVVWTAYTTFVLLSRLRLLREVMLD